MRIRFAVLLALACFLTNISQLPFFVVNDLTQYLSYSAWIVVFLVLLFLNKIEMRRIEFKIQFIGLSFMSGILLLELLTNNDYLSSGLLIPFFSSLFILLIGLFASNILDKKDIMYASYAYIISVFITSTYIFIEYFISNYNWIAGSPAYASKNSIAQIVLTGFIFLYVLYNPEKITLKIIRWFILVFWFILIFILESRATIVDLFIAITIIIFFSKLHKKAKLFISFLTIVTIMIVIISPVMRTIVVDGILLRGEYTLNNISADRIRHITILFPMLIEGYELLGTGTYYVENFPLNSLLKYGLLLGWIPIAIAVWPIAWAVKYLNKRDPIDVAFIIIAVVYLTNGLFEAQSPIGPGSKTYILWLLFGIMYGLKRKNSMIFSQKASINCNNQAC